MVQVMDLGLLILIDGICGLPSLDQEVEGTFVLVLEYAVRLCWSICIATYVPEIGIRWR